MKQNKRGKELIEDKGLPFAEEAECGVLSIALQNPTILTDLDQTLFYHPKNKLIAGALEALTEAGVPIDYISLTEYFSAKEEAFTAIGGASALAEIYSYVDSSSNLPHWFSILKDKKALRSVITACNDTIDEAYVQQDDVQGLLGRFYQRAAACSNANSQSTEKSIEEATDEWMDRYQKMMIGEIQTSMPTRWTCVNKKTPLRPGYTVIMGPRKSGKSCLGFNMMTDGTLREGRPGIIANYELQFHESMNRLIADYGNVPAHYLFAPDQVKPTKEVMKSIADTISVIRKSKLRIICNVRMTMDELCNKARATHAKYGDLMVMIDYLQILPDPRTQKKDQNREQDVARNSGAARDLSKELNIPVIALSQINKDGTTRESGAPENDCDLALRVDGEDGVKIHAQRNGPWGEHLPLYLEGEHFRFQERQWTKSGIPTD